MTILDGTISGVTVKVLGVEVGYVTPPYRDFSPGEFVWRRIGLLAEHGIRRVVNPPAW